jgi:2-keto-4-pentenoate hydratase/2-oxohepta-3-ene-1,7-dioic acid hydratase in catechol pathway
VPPAGDDVLALGDVELLPVVPRPEKIVCLGLNYREHIEEEVYDSPEYPVLSSRFRTR